MTAPATIAPVRTAFRGMLFAPEVNRARSARSRPTIYFYVINEV